MAGLLRASLLLLTARMEMGAAVLSEAAKAYPDRQFYRGYEQGLRDGLDGAEHAKKWLTERDKR